MSTLSAVLIVKNEKNLQACLETIRFADEIIVVDAGSTDRTPDIARQFTDKVYSHHDWQGYGKQRQLAQSYATCDWVLMIDADERVTGSLAEEIKRTIAFNDQSKVYAVPRLTWCFGAFIRHSGWYPDPVARLYPREKAKYSSDTVHEKLVFSHMTLVPLKSDLLHYTYDSLQHYLVKSAYYAELWSNQRLAEGKRSRLSNALVHGIGCFVRMYIVRAGFLDGRQGLLLALLSAHSTFVKHADLWLKFRQSRNHGQ